MRFVAEVPNYDRKLYTTCRLFAPAADGVSVPISIVYRTDKVRSPPLCLIVRNDRVGLKS